MGTKSIRHAHTDYAQHRQGFHEHGHVRHFHSNAILIVPFDGKEDVDLGQPIDITHEKLTSRTLGEKENLIHYAVVRGELWSPICEPELHWSVPLCSNGEQITCPECKSEFLTSKYNRS
jgi:hypothetical protein